VAADDALVAFEPPFQAFELGPVGRQANAEQADFAALGFGLQTISR
jgi:hypothetical protein